jgi:site-specific recombinase XerD
MPKPIKYDELYDKSIDGIYPKLKERFLNTISESTRNTYRYILAKAYRMELSLDKDIYEFSWNELDSLIKIYSNKSMQSIATNICCLRDYINFCIREGFVHDMVNYLDSVGGEDFLKQYLDVRDAENKYPTREILNDIQNRLFNVRDCVILELLFIGLTAIAIINNIFIFIYSIFYHIHCIIR